ncbi:hypothetical protein ACFVVM_16765 [Nocardia sp. NPDC058176]|uniref:hypothetical protein n=1 Tax=Nocardia sp. NPDC058176 TaxID=3346368 RepID=UPI0036DF4EBF
MTEPTNTTRPSATSAALDLIYEVSNPATGDQFVIYAPSPHDERGLFTVAHLTGTETGLATPRIHLVDPDDIAAYARGAVERMRTGPAGHTARVWHNHAPAALRALLPR